MIRRACFSDIDGTLSFHDLPGHVRLEDRGHCIWNIHDTGDLCIRKEAFEAFMAGGGSVPAVHVRLHALRANAYRNDRRVRDLLHNANVLLYV